MINVDKIINAMVHNEIDLLDEENIKIYKQSFVSVAAVKLLMVKYESHKRILVSGEGEIFNALQGDEKKGYKICPLSHDNRLVLNNYLDYTIPKAFGKDTSIIGLGDRLGLASPGHIKALVDKKVNPILAQQSVRELNLLNKTFVDVMDDACFSVFQEGYKEGFGADGDHLKKEDEVELALSLGFTMITLDCSEKIDNTIIAMDSALQEEKYKDLPVELREYYEKKYLNNTFKLQEHSIHYTKKKLIEIILIYNDAIGFIEEIYLKCIKNLKKAINFEISIDETLTATTPEAHYFVAMELDSKNIDIYSMAPRFCGEFQKGIDYIGSIEEFEKDFIFHVEIANVFEYKLSIHSGSDKFSIYPIISKYTKGRFHVKTAGTSWLEAMRLISRVNPQLYRNMHKHALEHFNEAKAYYHVTTDITKIKPIDDVDDVDLDQYLEDNNARQLIHITYGILFNAKNKSGELLFKKDFFDTLNKFEEGYYEVLIKHIGKHLSLLGK